MPFAIRERQTPAPEWASFPELWIQVETNAAFMARLQGRNEEEMSRRFAAGHRAYVAWIGDEPAGWGWSATRTAEIGEVGSTFEVPERERYLWNFVTLAAFRGRGIYPRLLDGIVRAEILEADRFWVGYAPENHASGAGIRKAGFTDLAELSFDAAGRPAIRAIVPGGGSMVAGLLGLPEVGEALSPCWRCARMLERVAGECSGDRCACDYQRVETGCAA